MQSLDKNGSFLQRRKMYIGLPLHNMKSKLQFDWQGDDTSVQEQVGKRYKLKQENELIRKKYNDTLEKRIYHKYVEHQEQMPYALRSRVVAGGGESEEDTLAKEVQHFNSSKMMTLPLPQKAPEEQAEGAVNLLQNNAQGMQKYNRPNDRLNQSFAAEPQLPSSREMRHSSQEQHQYIQPEAIRDRNFPNHPYEVPYYPNPQNYHTISPQADRYRPFKPDPYPQYASPSRYVQKMYTGTVPTDYPFRNVLPDKLQNHLREKVKADRKSLKVSLNLFDYNRP